ncbi:hypothetical protein ACQHIV_42275 (plasmid) [Kribbella sp. GL6]|uniref:hypothetical protein n=1 Tax=Kribbella sp. GL6 TaxID=3419765 RepID=UPI003CFED77B
MSTGSNDHNHGAGFQALADPLGRPVDGLLMSEFIGSAFDGCTACQDAQLTLLIEDPATSARVVELACVAVQGKFGGLPDGMTDPAAAGPAAPEFRQLARAGLDARNDAMFQECARMTTTQRRAAVNTAADVLVGMMSMPDITGQALHGTEW